MARNILWWRLYLVYYTYSSDCLFVIFFCLAGFHSPEPISSISQTSTLNNSALNNPRLPPYPPPVTVVPLAQIKQPAILASVGAVTGMTGNATRPRSACSQTAAVSDYVCISTCFGSSRGHFVTSSKGTREKNGK